MLPRSRRYIVSLLALMVAALTGCRGVRFEGEDSIHYLVIGIGIVSVPKNHAEIEATIIRSHSLGLTVTNAPGNSFSLGYTRSAVIFIPDEAKDLTIEVEDTPTGMIRVTVPKSSNL